MDTTTHGIPFPEAAVDPPRASQLQDIAEAVDEKLLAGGSSVVATSESRTSTSYGLLPTADRAQNVVVPAGALVEVDYQALWKTTSGATARAALFIGSNQLAVAVAGMATPQAQAARCLSPHFQPVHSCPLGLIAPTDEDSGYFTTDVANVTTGQVVGSLFPHDAQTDADAANLSWSMDVGGTNYGAGNLGGMPVNSFLGGPIRLFVAAGTYDFSVQYKIVSAGTLTVKDRRLWVRVIPG